MLYKVKTLKNYKLESIDGEIGKIKEFYFDDLHWTVRYLIVDTGGWLTGRQVLISPHALLSVSTEKENIGVNLTKKQIEDGPSLNSDKPVSRQFEQVYHGYYGWPVYWNGPYMWGMYPYILRGSDKMIDPIQNEKTWDPDLRSTREVSGYHIQGSDGEIGHIEDFIIDHEIWAIRYLIIDTKNWWKGKKVLISPKWIERVSWKDSKVFINLSREDIIKSPEFSEMSLLNREYESKLHKHYNRHEYWIDKPVQKIHTP